MSRCCVCLILASAHLSDIVQHKRSSALLKVQRAWRQCDWVTGRWCVIWELTPRGSARASSQTKGAVLRYRAEESGARPRFGKTAQVHSRAGLGSCIWRLLCRSSTVTAFFLSKSFGAPPFSPLMPRPPQHGDPMLVCFLCLCFL